MSADETDQGRGLTTRFEDNTTHAAYLAWMNMTCGESLKGDPVATSAAAFRLLVELQLGNPLSEPEKAWLLAILGRIHEDKSAAIAVCRPAKAVGAASKGYPAFLVAWAVLDAAFLGGAKSMEEAWAIVAEERNLAEGTVKRHWMRWKEKVFEVCETVQPGMPKNVKEMLASNKKIMNGDNK